jgi:hypothetical protein
MALPAQISCLHFTKSSKNAAVQRVLHRANQSMKIWLLGLCTSSKAAFKAPKKLSPRLTSENSARPRQPPTSFGQGTGTKLPRDYSVAMGGQAIIHLETAIAAEIWREIGIAKARIGHDWHLLSIVNSWGDTMDDHETLQAIQTLNRTGSTVVNLICTVH